MKSKSSQQYDFYGNYMGPDYGEYAADPNAQMMDDGNMDLTGDQYRKAGVRGNEPALPDTAAVNKGKLAGDGMTAAGVMSANPYLAGAGLGLSAISTFTAAENQRRMNRYNAEVQKYNQRQQAIARMAEIGKNLKA